MALFKEINCKHCGKKTSLLSRIRLKDDTHVCTKCAQTVPSFIHLGDYTYEDFISLLEYIEMSNAVLSKQFRENHSYYSIHADTEHGIFYIGDFGKRFYLRLEDLDDFSLEFCPETVKEGFLGDKCTGKLYLRMRMGFPYFYKEELLDASAKASAEIKGIFSKTAHCQNPKGMDDFLNHFNYAWRRAVEEKYRLLANELAANPLY